MEWKRPLVAAAWLQDALVATLALLHPVASPPLGLGCLSVPAIRWQMAWTKRSCSYGLLYSHKQCNARVTNTSKNANPLISFSHFLSFGEEQWSCVSVQLNFSTAHMSRLLYNSSSFVCLLPYKFVSWFVLQVSVQCVLLYMSASEPLLLVFKFEAQTSFEDYWFSFAVKAKQVHPVNCLDEWRKVTKCMASDSNCFFFFPSCWLP